MTAVSPLGGLTELSLAEMKARIVPGEAPVPPRGRLPDIGDHLAMLRLEFAGRSELEFYHVALMVLARRHIDPDDTARRIDALWRAEAAFLCARLNSRWLVSACDTFIDVAADPAERALAAAAMLFINTIKLYETERRLTGAVDIATDTLRPPGGHELFDGLTRFNLGTGNMVANLQQRIQSVTAGATPTAMILAELLRRANTHDTVFRRFRRLHTREDTAW